MTSRQTSNPSDIQRLLQIMADLRNPDGGCPWDLEQDFASIAPYTVEEAYEVADAIRRGDMAELKDELGDLLFQVVYHAQLAEEKGFFAFPDVVETIAAKMVRRHPHVFGDADIASAAAQTANWEEIKAAERAAKATAAPKGGANQPASLMDNVPLALPALMRAEKLARRAARVGFDWTDPQDVFAKIDEESAEVREAAESGDSAAVFEEIGDLLFAAANLARVYGVAPEDALQAANEKFAARFRHMEADALKHSESLADMTLGELETLWRQAKSAKDEH